MKNLIFIFAIFAISFAVKAQTNSTVTIGVEYKLAPGDSVTNNQNIFIGRVLSGLNSNDMKLMMDYSGQRILNHVKMVDSIRNYSPFFDIGRIYSTSMTVTDIRNVSPEYFFQANSTIALMPGLAGWGNRNSADYFHLKNGMAVSLGVSVFSDYSYCIGYDSIMEPSKKGKKNKFVARPIIVNPQESEMYFAESWSFDAVNGKFLKSTNYIGFMSPKILSTGEMLGYVPFLCIDNPGSANKYSYEDYKYVMEDPFGNVPSEDRTKFFAAILYFAIKNPQNVFPMKENEIDSLHPFKSLQSVYELFHSVDSTIQVEDPMNPGTFFLAPITFETPMSMIYGLRFYEDWYYDSKEMVMKKVVKGIGLLVEEYHWDGTSAIVDKGIYIKVN
ncbi:MAG: hypothetical protein NT084_05370 [Bacteroidetes bacterium]|nr:hypothetical protein [Bacteroidota bacterium]